MIVISYYACRITSGEYKSALNIIRPIVEKHRSTLIPGEPQLNYCDDAVMVSSLPVHIRSASGLPL